MDPNQYGFNPWFQQNSSNPSYQYPNPSNSSYQYPHPNQPNQYNLNIPPQFSTNPNFCTQIPNFGFCNSEFQSQSNIPTSNSPMTRESFNENEDEGVNLPKKTFKWSYDEDKVLVSAWLNTSLDPVTNINQTRTTFWSRIKEYVVAEKPQLSEHSPQALRKRWELISTSANAWGACYEEASRNALSGWSEDDIEKCAFQIFHAKYKGKLSNAYKRHWEYLLRDQPKWKAQYQKMDRSTAAGSGSGSSKRTKNNADGAFTSSSGAEGTSQIPIDEVQSPCRPEGLKAAKKKGKRTSSVATKLSFDVDSFAPLEKMASELERNREMLDRKLKMQEEKLRLEAEKIKVKERRDDMKIIMMNPFAEEDEMKRQWLMNYQDELRKKWGSHPK